MEEQLALLSVYPEPGAVLEHDPADEASSNVLSGGECGGGAGGCSPTRTKGQTVDSGEMSPVRSQNGDPQNFQEKADEVFQSITTSFATTVTDMFGRKDKEEMAAAAGAADAPPPAPPSKGGNDESRGSGGGGGWDLFKAPSMADMKRRLEDIKISGIGLSPPRRSESTAAAQPGRTTASSVKARSVSPTPRRTTQEGGLAAFGDGWRDLRRRSTEAVNDAVTKLKSALDDSDDDDELKPSGSRVGPTAKMDAGQQGKAARAATTAGNGREDDEFWKPFGGGGADIDADEEPVPLPSVGEVRGRGDGRGETSATRAQADLFAYYGGGGP